MLREHDLFEVVLNPGADKREKLVLGQITRPAGDTGRIMLGCGRKLIAQIAAKARLNISSLSVPC